MQRLHSRWALEEDMALLRMRAAKKPRREIAIALRRSFEAVSQRLKQRHGVHLGPVKPLAPTVHEVLIAKSQVVEFYELGWRFVGFEGAACRFEYKGEAPRWPAADPLKDRSQAHNLAREQNA